MSLKWYWAHDGQKFIEFENPQERTAFNIIQPALDKAFETGELCHILVNLQKCNGHSYMPDMLFLKSDGAGVVDLKHYAGPIGIRMEKRGRFDYPLCVNGKGELFAHNPEYKGEFNQVIDYSLTLKRLVKLELGLEDLGLKVSFALCFTGTNADFSEAKRFVSENWEAPAMSLARHADLCLPADLPQKINASVLGRLPPGKRLTEEKARNLINAFGCKNRDFTEQWIEIDGAGYSKRSILVGRRTATAVQDVQLPGDNVSQFHLLIIKGGYEEVIIRDTSRHGTEVNGVLLRHDEVSVPLSGVTPIRLVFPDKSVRLLKSPSKQLRAHTALGS